MNRFYHYLLFVFFIIQSMVSFAQVSVTATAGTTGPTVYTSLKYAFDAINAGTHQGNINIAIQANTLENAPCVLNSSAAGAASYTSIHIFPTADGLIIAGPTATGRGLIELNGADNIIIDGDNQNTSGINQNLTITNTAANTITYTSVIRIAVAATVVTSADNILIKNLMINGSATGRNISTATSITGSESTTSGIYASGGASTVSETIAPSAVTVNFLTAPNGSTINNLRINNNLVNSCAKGITVQAGNINVINTLTITKNTIGAATQANATTVYNYGITAQGFAAASIADNLVQNIEGFAGNTIKGIDIGSFSSAANLAVVERNRVLHLTNHFKNTSGCYGINVFAGSNHTLQNNFVADLQSNMRGGSAFSTLSGILGIRLAGGTGHKIYHNSVNLYGLRPGNASSELLSAAFGIESTSITGVDVRNNIFANSITGGITSVANVSIYLPNDAGSGFNLTLNNNAYFTGTIAGVHGVAQGGENYYETVFSPGYGLYKVADFNAGSTTPIANFRSYSRYLSVAGTNDNASFANNVALPFTSDTDLHIPAGKVGPLESSGATLSIITDIDNDSRPGASSHGFGTAPDLGADEFDGIFQKDIIPPAIIFTPLPNMCTSGNQTLTATINDATGVPTSGIGLPVLYFKINAGAYIPVQGISIGSNQYTFTFGSAAVAGDVVSYYIVAQDLAIIPNLISIPLTGAAGFTSNPPVAATPPTTPAMYVFGQTLSGNYTIGASGAFPSLSAAVTQYNAACNITGPITFSLTDANYPSETYPIVINENPLASATNTLTIKPATGASPLLSSGSAITTIKIYGADYIIIDGSNNGTNSRDLTIENGYNKGASVWVASTTTSGATNITIKNTNLQGEPNTISGLGIVASSGGFIEDPADVSNDNLTITNNKMIRSLNGFFGLGNATTQDKNWVITGNTLGSATPADNLFLRGMAISNARTFIVMQNQVVGLSTTTMDLISGISVIGNSSNGTISRNTITNIKNNLAGGYGANGILLYSNSAVADITTSNNFISDVTGEGAMRCCGLVNGDGIVIGLGAGYKIYYNTVSLNTNQKNAGYPAAISILSSVTIANAIDLRDNIFVNTQTQAGERYAIYSFAPNSVFSNINFNDYYSTGPNVGYIDVYRPTLGDIQTGFGMNTNSINVLPIFISPTNLHIDPSVVGNMAIDNKGTPLAVNIDIDNDSRSATIPDMGADEFNFGVLPIALEYFHGTKQSVANQLDWKVGCNGPIEITIQQSADNSRFTDINTQNATAIQCQQPFRYFDNNPLSGNNYYRLKMTSIDGEEKYSNIVLIINKEKPNALISIIPNPVGNSAVLNASFAKEGKIVLVITDAQGKIVSSSSTVVRAGINKIPLQLDNLPSGTYLVTAKMDSGGSETMKIVKN